MTIDEFLLCVPTTEFPILLYIFFVAGEDGGGRGRLV